MYRKTLQWNLHILKNLLIFFLYFILFYFFLLFDFDLTIARRQQS